MNGKMISVNVKTIDSDSVVVDVLSVNNCAPQQLNSILSLCKPGMKVEIEFVEVDIPNGMRPQVNN